MGAYELALEIDPPVTAEVRWKHGNKRGIGAFELLGTTGDGGADWTRYEIAVYLREGSDLAQDTIFVDAANIGAALDRCIKALTNAIKKEGFEVVYVRGRGPDL